VSLKEVNRELESAGVVDVVGIQPADDLSTRNRESFVDGVRLSAIRLGYPATAGRILPQNVNCFISAAGVEDQQLNVLETLIENAQYGSLDESALIERGRYNRNAHASDVRRSPWQ
jgi:hypothetical protein